jgi:hypothetical protein
MSLSRVRLLFVISGVYDFLIGLAFLFLHSSYPKPISEK